MTLTDNKEATICLGKAKVIKSEIKRNNRAILSRKRIRLFNYSDDRLGR